MCGNDFEFLAVLGTFLDFGLGMIPYLIILIPLQFIKLTWVRDDSIFDYSYPITIYKVDLHWS